MVFDSEPVIALTLPGNVHLWKMLTVTLTFESMTLKMKSMSCGRGNE